jgi:hypothetical protein
MSDVEDESRLKYMRGCCALMDASSHPIYRPNHLTMRVRNYLKSVLKAIQSLRNVESVYDFWKSGCVEASVDSVDPNNVTEVLPSAVNTISSSTHSDRSIDRSCIYFFRCGWLVDAFCKLLTVGQTAFEAKLGLSSIRTETLHR